MRIPRIFVPETLQSGARVSLMEDAANHVARVLRLKPGAALVLFDGTGGEFEAVLNGVVKRQVLVDIGSPRERNLESPLALTLIQAVSRGDRMDFTLQKAVELGVSRIVPVFSARSMVALEGERKERRHEHWFKVIIGACEQSGRNRLPELLPLQPLDQALHLGSEGLRLVLDPLAEEGVKTLPHASEVTLLVGPEGGLDGGELARAQAAGFRGLRMGPRVLRTETAALVALAALQAQWGDLG